MFRPLASSVRTPAPRRGALLIAVLGLLTLFAIFALFFVFYADAEATGARIYREGEANGEDGPPNDFARAAFTDVLSAAIFPVDDMNAQHPMRGHELGRSMYGWNATFVGATAGTPFSGHGTLHENAQTGTDSAYWINYSGPLVVPGAPVSTSYWRDPEWSVHRTGTEITANIRPGTPGATRPFQVHMPKNAPYTYPDLKDLILASVSPATGEVLVPSLHRNWLFNGGVGGLPGNPNVNQRLAEWNPNDDPALVPGTTTFRAYNTDWVNPEGRTRILRPRPIDQLTAADIAAVPAIGLTGGQIPPGWTGLGTTTLAQKQALYNLIRTQIAAGLIIPYPPFNSERKDQFDNLNVNGNPTYTGDVQNLMGSVGHQKNDSILIDIGLPPRKWNGKWIKPLASILLTDLDGLLNLNAHGNMRGGVVPQPTNLPNGTYDRGYHQSYAGYAANEVNLGKVLGDTEAANVVQARYGIAAWAWNTPYVPGMRVVNAGNFYVCTGPMGGGVSAPAGPGPTGTTPPSDNGLTWVGISVSLARNNVPVLTHTDRLYPLFWTPSTAYSFGARVQNNNGQYFMCTTAGISAAVPPGPVYTGTATGITDNSVVWSYYVPDRVPAYASVNSDAGGNSDPLIPTGARPQLPGFANTVPNPFATSPNFPTSSDIGMSGIVPPQDFNQDGGGTYVKALNHPLLFNPSDWPTGNAGRRLYPFGDFKRFNIRYAADRDYYLQTDVARSLLPANPPLVPSFPVANGSLIGTPGTYFHGPVPPMRVPSTYRLDPAHATRGLVNTLSTNIDMGSLVGNFNTSNPASVFALTGTQVHPTRIAPGSFAGGAGNDFVGPQDYRNPKAMPAVATDARTGVLGPIDLNRTLADYRTDTTIALGQPAGTDTTNSGNTLQAWADRHNLARDILGRLIVATGANASVITQATGAYLPGDILINATVGTPDYNAIRYLAQIAANMVDSIDNDDVSTAFAWELGPVGVPGAMPPIPPRTITRLDTVSLPLATAAAAGQAPTGLVYGVEKPRLVINEAYGELTNADEALGMMPTMNMRVRFYVELMNPTNSPYAAGTGPLGDGRATLNVAGLGYQPYQLQITREGGTVKTALANPTNATGSLPAAADLTHNFSTATGTMGVILPNVAPYWNSGTNATGTLGSIVVGPPAWTNPHSDGTNPIEFNPDTTAAPWNQMIPGTASGGAAPMEYDFGSIPMATDLEANVAANPLIGLRRNVVLLRRLANPYQTGPTATNPYITVDVMDWVPAFDAVAKGGGVMAVRTPKGAMSITAAGFEDAGNRYSVGKVQPYAGFADATPWNMGTDAFPLIQVFPASMVLAQNPTTAPPPATPKHTFFRMNGRNNGTTEAIPTAQTYTFGPPAVMNANGAALETIMAPFDWYVHYDRPIANQFELFSVQAVKSHDVTDYAIRPPFPAGGPIRRNLGLVPWLGVSNLATPGLPTTDTTGLPTYDNNPTFNPNLLTNNGLYRALDVLRTKSWTYGTALGGKVHGKININTIQDIRVLQALLDAAPPAWRASTMTTPAIYQVGQRVSCNGNIYVMIDTIPTGGTTGASAMSPSTGPSGGQASIADNTVVWQYVRTAGGNSFNQTDIDILWASYITGPGGRTFSVTNRATANGQGVAGGVPGVGPSIYDVPNPTGGNFDRPFLPFGGVPELVPDGSNSAFRARGGSTAQETLLRTPVPWVSGMTYYVGQRVSMPALGTSYICVGFTVMGATSGTSGASGPSGTGSNITDGTVIWNYIAPAGQPLVWSTNVNSSHPYLQAEMARKMFNNVTTTSNAFGITVTIVFHEVRMNGTTPMWTTEGAGQRFLIGKEAYKEIPGDLRQVFYAVVDRSNIMLDANPAFPQILQRRPFFGAMRSSPQQDASGWKVYLENTYFDSTIGSFAVMADGVRVLPSQLTSLVLGTGAHQEPIASIGFDPVDGAVRLSSPPNFLHLPGELVSNCIPGNPGLPDAWAPAKSYGVNHRVFNGTNVYVCTTPGISGGGAGPTGTGPAPIADGSVVWSYLMPHAPFDPLAPINAYRAIVPYAQRIR